MRNMRFAVLSFLSILTVLALGSCAASADQINRKGERIRIHRVIEINDVEQFIDIRGETSELPILLIVHGGPGTPETPLFNYFCPELENQFIVVNWDQRGAGASLIEEVPSPETMTIDQFIEDTRALTDYLRNEFNRRQIYILGHSWGSKLALLTVKKYPDRYIAYIGIGLSVNLSKSEPKNYQRVYDWAKEDGNEQAIAQLESISEPPYVTYDFNDVEKMGILRMWAMFYGGGPVNLAKKDLEATMGLLNTSLSECEGYQYFAYDMTIEKFYAGESAMPPEFVDATNNCNLDEAVSAVSIPFFVLQGVDDAQTNFEVARDYFEMVDAPHKEFFTFESSSHSPPFEEPEKFYDVMHYIAEVSQ